MVPHRDRELIAIVHTHKHPSDSHHHDDSLKEKAKEFIESHLSDSENSPKIRAEFEYSRDSKPEFNSYDPWLNQDGYKEYIEKHDHHFSRKLAILASSMMENDNGSEYHATPEGVKAMWSTHGLSLPKTATWGDATYSFNMHYADYFGDPLKTEDEVLRESYKDITDKDGYPGKIFNRWLSDIVYKGISIPWKDVM